MHTTVFMQFHLRLELKCIDWLPGRVCAALCVQRSNALPAKISHPITHYWGEEGDWQGGYELLFCSAQSRCTNWLYLAMTIFTLIWYYTK